MTPSAGKRTMGNKLVTGIGMVSQIQNTAMTNATAATLCASKLMPSGVGISSSNINPSGAMIRPVSARLLNVCLLFGVSGSLLGGLGWRVVEGAFNLLLFG